jgi:hypothetical protein
MYIDIPAHLAQYDSEIAQVICEKDEPNSYSEASQWTRKVI